MKLWRRFRAMWRDLSTLYRAIVGALLGFKVLLIIGSLLTGQPLRALVYLATLLVLVWFFGIGQREPVDRDDQDAPASDPVGR